MHAHGRLDSADGGPLSDAPPYDCENEIVAEPSPDGSGYAIAAGPVAVSGRLAFAVLPVAVADRIAVAAPADDASLKHSLHRCLWVVASHRPHRRILTAFNR